MSTLLPPIEALQLVGVADRGVPNQERVILRPTRRVNLGPFVLCAAAKLPGNLNLPMFDHVCWLGDDVLEPPYWILAYTGPGTRRWTQTVTGKEPALVVHWGRDTTIFHDENVVPIVFELSGILTEQMQPALPPPPPPSSGTDPEVIRKLLPLLLNPKNKPAGGE